MEMYPSSGNGTTETYMIPGTGPNPQLSLLPPPEEFGFMANAVAPEATYDQGLYYPTGNYYSYYSTGLEQQSEWNEQHMFFGGDGREVVYSGLQSESYPYLYYSPSYDYAQSSYNPYNPYIPGAVFGPDSPVIGSHQYFPDPSYQLPVSSQTAYVPMVVQPRSDAVPNSSAPSLSGIGTSVTSRQASAGSKHSQAHISSNRGATSQGTASRNLRSEPVKSEMSTNVSFSRRSSSLITSGTIGQMNQMGTSSGLMQATDQFSYGNVPYVQNTSIFMPNNLPSNYGTGVRGWAAVDQFRPRSQFNGAGKNWNQNPGILSEQNRGPRTNKSKSQWVPTVSVQMSEAGAEAHKAIVIRSDQYNRDDFSVDYPDAKFFVIKSYSEDDVHKSVKYNVWSSTTNGNKRLDAAYEDAHRISAGKPRGCPVFLFFSVNASGQFCGVAEMVGPVDFLKDMDFWQQDKWTGSFPVKWHIIKDVPNTSFRHILLENNENKPVTNSRDTQEVMYIPGIDMLNIFKNSPLTTSILDDFMFYEERQKIIQEDKSRLTGRSNTYLPAFVSASKPIEPTEQNESADHSSEDSGQSFFRSDQSLKADGKRDVDHPVADAILHNYENEESKSGECLIDQQVFSKSIASKLSDDKIDDRTDQIYNADVATSIIKMNSLSVDSEEGNNGSVLVKDSAETDVVTVGSMHIKVNGALEPSSAVI